MSYSFPAAMAACNDTDIKRIACVALNSELTNTNWQKAADDFGSASFESMKVMYRNALRKIINEEANGPGTSGPPAAPTPRKSSPKKRKNENGEASDKPAKKSRGRKDQGPAPVQNAAMNDEETVKPDPLEEVPVFKYEGYEDFDLYSATPERDLQLE